MSEYTPTTEEIIRSFAIPPHRVIEREPDESFADYLSRLSIEGHGYQLESEAAARRWLAAHDAEVRAGVVTEEPEWEYGVEHVQVDGWVERELHLNRQEALDDYRTCGMSCTLMRRRKADPWAPVEQDGADDV